MFFVFFVFFMGIYRVILLLLLDLFLLFGFITNLLFKLNLLLLNKYVVLCLIKIKSFQLLHREVVTELG